MPPLKPVPTLRATTVTIVAGVLKGLCINDQVTEEQLTPVIDLLQEYLPLTLQTAVLDALTPDIQDEFIYPDTYEGPGHFNSKYLLLCTVLNASLMCITRRSVTPAMKKLNGANIQSLMIKIVEKDKSTPVESDSGESSTNSESNQEENDNNEQIIHLEPLYDFLLTLTNLTKLECSLICNGKMLQLVSKSCPCLEEVSLCNCDIDDQGIFHLAGHTPTKDSYKLLHTGGRLSSVSVCKKLKRVILYCFFSNKLTTEAVAMLLHLCPMIEKLDCYVNIGEALTLLHGIKDTYEDIAAQYSLKKCSYSGDSETELSLIIKTCPKLESLKLWFKGSEESYSTIFSNLLYLTLKTLDLINGNIGALLWYLNQRGGNLTSLTIRPCTLTRTQLQNLIRACPNLEKLDLLIHELVPDVPYSDLDQHASPFHAPFHLHLSIFESPGISGEDLTFLVGQCQQLNMLSISDEGYLGKAIDTNVLHRLLAMGSLKNLSTLLISYQTLTLADLWAIVDQCPHLHIVGELHTWDISGEEFTQFSNEIDNNNWDLNIIF